MFSRDTHIKPMNNNQFPDLQTPAILNPSAFDELQRLLDTVPQCYSDGRRRYLLTGGLPVELITGRRRFHKDVDIVILQRHHRDVWSELKYIDSRTPENYWGHLDIQPEYFDETAWPTKLNIHGRAIVVMSVHPAILMVQKLTDHIHLVPRRIDLTDVANLVDFMRSGQHQWNQVLDAAVDAV